MITDALTYDEAIELAAALYTGRRLTEMALCGDLGMRRVPEADRPATQAMLAELKATSANITALTRRGEGYAIKFALDSDGAPTDANLAKVLGRCCRAPRPAEYPGIRSNVDAYRAGRIPHTHPHDARSH